MLFCLNCLAQEAFTHQNLNRKTVFGQVSEFSKIGLIQKLSVDAKVGNVHVRRLSTKSCR